VCQRVCRAIKLPLVNSRLAGSENITAVTPGLSRSISYSLSVYVLSERNVLFSTSEIWKVGKRHFYRLHE
jgi:hypothetical protein